MEKPIEPDRGGDIRSSNCGKTDVCVCEGVERMRLKEIVSLMASSPCRPNSLSLDPSADPSCPTREAKNEGGQGHHLPSA